jgi:muramidase (phage lysozyme)
MATSRYKENLELLKKPEIQAMLRVIRNAEGTDNDRGYNTRVGYTYFNNLDKKPGKKVWIPSIKDYSSAEGAYQFLNTTWEGLSKDLGLKDFSRQSQDVAAVELLRKSGSLKKLLEGDFKSATHLAAPVWASLPTASGQGAYRNQRAKKLEHLKNIFKETIKKPYNFKDVEDDYYVSETTKGAQKYQENSEPLNNYYVDSTVKLNEDSGEYMSANAYYESEESTEDTEGNLAKQELQQAQQEKNFVNELFNQQQQQEEVAQGYNQNASGYQLYMPELPEFQAQQAPSYFQEGGTVGKIDYEKFKKSLQRFEEGGDFVDTYLEEGEDNLFGEQPKTFQQQLVQDYKKNEKPASTPKPTKNPKPTSKVDESISQYGAKPGEKVKVDERALRVKPFTGVKEGANKEYVEKLQKKELEKRGLTAKEIQAKAQEAELKNSVDYFTKQLSGKATLEDTLENKDIDLGIGLSNYKTVEERKKLQKFLIDQGYNLNPEGKFENAGVDGKIGKVTLKAVQDYNRNLSNPNYYSFKEGEGLLGQCTEGQCSEYTQNELFRNIQPTVSREDWNAKTGLYGNAWDIGKNITTKGGKEVDKKTVKPGDVVTMFTGGRSSYQGEANAAGTGTTHVGIVDKVNPDGSYYILHNVHTLNMSGDYEGREFRDLVKNNSIVSDTNTGFQVKHAFRPKYEAVESGEKKVLREDLAIKIDPKKASKLSSGDYNNFFTSKSAKEKLENYFIKPLNDSKNKKALSKVFNLGDDEYNSLAKASLGILGQESEFGTSKNYTTGNKRFWATAAKTTGLKNSEVSKGAGQMKYETNFGNDDLTEIGVTRDNFNDEDKASLTTMYKLSRDYKKFLNKGFNKKDALYRAVTNYNSSMGRVVQGKKVEDWAKDYDVDYTNKVLNFSNFFDVTDGKKSYKTTSDNLLLNKNVAKWRAELQKDNKL